MAGTGGGGRVAAAEWGSWGGGWLGGPWIPCLHIWATQQLVLSRPSPGRGWALNRALPQKQMISRQHTFPSDPAIRTGHMDFPAASARSHIWQQKAKLTDWSTGCLTEPTQGTASPSSTAGLQLSTPQLNRAPGDMKTTLVVYGPQLSDHISAKSSSDSKISCTERCCHNRKATPLSANAPKHHPLHPPNPDSCACSHLTQVWQIKLTWQQQQSQHKGPSTRLWPCTCQCSSTNTQHSG